MSKDKDLHDYLEEALDNFLADIDVKNVKNIQVTDIMTHLILFAAKQCAIAHFGITQDLAPTQDYLNEKILQISLAYRTALTDYCNEIIKNSLKNKNEALM